MSRRALPFRFLSLAASALTLGACATIVPQPTSVAQYDIGPLAQRAGEGAQAAVRIEILAPPWLESSAMQYRLDATDPARRRAYAHSRWVSPPPAMLRGALARALGGVEGNGACRLRIELDEFIQRFDPTGASRAEILLRARLLPPRGGEVLAARAFDAIAAAPGADAPGGVQAHREAVGVLANGLGQWLLDLDGEADIAARCGTLVRRGD